MKRLLVTGSRDWTDQVVVIEALWKAVSDLGGMGMGDEEPITLVHGAAPGADAIASMVWATNQHPEEPHPAQWAAHGNAAGPIRNKEMVDLGADLCLAFHKNGSRGTQNTIDLCRAAGIEVRVYEEPA